MFQSVFCSLRREMKSWIQPVSNNKGIAKWILVSGYVRTPASSAILCMGNRSAHSLGQECQPCVTSHAEVPSLPCEPLCQATDDWTRCAAGSWQPTDTYVCRCEGWASLGRCDQLHWSDSASGQFELGRREKQPVSGEGYIKCVLKVLIVIVSLCEWGRGRRERGCGERRNSYRTLLPVSLPGERGVKITPVSGRFF